jgi:selenocysteine-specific elongation factor
MAKRSTGIFNIVIGTAGHIDHGKSVLVQKLTGIDPDRLKEEKERGMTIDLGFAPLDLPDGRKVGIIDVPGHERFIKNMVAGSTGIDLALIVVAADDGIMPQTREHMDIMRLLGVRRGIVAVTKIDLVEEDLLEIVLEEIEDFVKGTFLEGAPVVPLSSHTGEGIVAFRAEIFRLIETMTPHTPMGVFRMPIQRVFSAKGFGTVVTGVPLAGHVAVGDVLEILPQGFRGRVRGIQAYKEVVDRASAGHSTALNLSDVDYKTVVRGNVVAEPGCFRVASLLEGRFEYLESQKRPLRNRSTVRFHAGTNEVLGSLILLDAKELEPGQRALCQFRLEEPVVVTPGDRYILRLHSPMVTIGGGVILGASGRRLKAFKPYVIEQLSERERALGDPKALLEVALKEAGFRSMGKRDLALEVGFPEDKVGDLISELTGAGTALSIGRGDRVVHRESLERATGTLLDLMDVYYEEKPFTRFVSRIGLRGRSKLPEPIYDKALERLIEEGAVILEGRDRLIRAGREIVLTPEQRDLVERTEHLFREAAYATPGAEEAAETLGVDPRRRDEFLSLLSHLVEEGRLVAMREGILYHVEAVEGAKKILRDEFGALDEFNPASFRDRLGTTRKYVIPLLEYFDESGLTERVNGGRRVRR